jgi:hypothetical protein
MQIDAPEPVDHKGYQQIIRKNVLWSVPFCHHG